MKIEIPEHLRAAISNMSEEDQKKIFGIMSGVQNEIFSAPSYLEQLKVVRSKLDSFIDMLERQGSGKAIPMLPPKS